MTVAGTEREQRAGAELCRLLERPPYSRLWSASAARSRATLNQSAVARVITHYLWDAGLRPDTEQHLHRELKDRVRRALHGEVLSAETLTWFIEAFDMAEPDATRLRDILLVGRIGGEVLSGRLAAPQGPPGQHRTVSIHELHRVGPDGRPAEHRTVHVIEALIDGLDHYPFRFDTATADVEVLRGGKAGPLVAEGDAVHRVDIMLPRPLRIGETASLEYRTVFRWREAPPPIFRRAATRRVDNVELRVEFHPDRLPARVWWATWQSLDGEPDERRPVLLDAERAVHHYLAAMERIAVGFQWEW